MSSPDSYTQRSLLPVGYVLHDNYRIDGYLASGGFGNTYAVTHLSLEKRMALKEFFMKGVTHREPDSSTVSVSNSENKNLFNEQKRKFKKEAQRIFELTNDHIVKVYDLFDANNTVYYAMEFVEGESLNALMKLSGKPFDESVTVDVLRQMLIALDAIHQRSIWHMDIKPGNIMMDKTGKCTLIDFGSSKQTEKEGGATTSTAMSYTPGYAPPEQINGSSKKWGPWTDFYALGATLYNLMTMEKPPLADDIIDEEEKAFFFPNNISEPMKALVIWMMQPRSTKRPASSDDIRQYLGSFEFFQPKAVPDSAEEVTIIEQKPPRQQQPEAVPAPVDTEKTMVEGKLAGRKAKPVQPQPTPKTDKSAPKPDKNASNKQKEIDRPTKKTAANPATDLAAEQAIESADKPTTNPVSKPAADPAMPSVAKPSAKTADKVVAEPAEKPQGKDSEKKTANPAVQTGRKSSLKYYLIGAAAAIILIFGIMKLSSSGSGSSTSKSDEATKTEAVKKTDSSEAAAKPQVEAQRQAESNAQSEAQSKRQAETQPNSDADAKRQAEAKSKADSDAKRQADAKRKAEAESRRQAEAKAKADSDAKRKTEAESKRQAEAKAKADAAAKRMAESKAKAEAEAKRRAEESKRQAEAEAKRRAAAFNSPSNNNQLEQNPNRSGKTSTSSDDAKRKAAAAAAAAAFDFD